MLDFLELEETVGRLWHRFAGQSGSFPHHPAAAVTLASMQGVIGPFFRAFGGESGLRIAAAPVRGSRHRLRLAEAIGLGEERLPLTGRDGQGLLLPPVIALYPDKDLNRDLYLWLAGFMALMPRRLPAAGDPLAADLSAIDAAAATARRLVTLCPGLAPVYRRLADGHLATRRRGALPRIEAAVEQRIRAALGGTATDHGAVTLPERAPPGYLPALPVPLWPRFLDRAPSAPRETADPPPAATADGMPTAAETRRAIRETPQSAAERSPFVLNRFEKILSMSEMISVDRPTDDSDDEAARAADDLEDMVLGERRGKPASRFRFDLDLPPESLTAGRITAEITYPEWSYADAAYLPDQVRVIERAADTLPGDSPADPETQMLIRRVRRQFEALRPRRQTLRGERDGQDLDLDRIVRRAADLAAGCEGSDGIFTQSRPASADLCVSLLVDVSLSTDAFVDNRRILDVEKQALLVLANGIAAAGDRQEILAFSSRRRDRVMIDRLKRFDEPMGSAVEARIGALRPGFYTRMGAAIRHATAGLKAEPNRQKLLVILTDGKPNDIDYYEGRFALEDTRRAVGEARAHGIAVFAVTVDRAAGSYLPALFGTTGYRLVARLDHLPAALPSIYRALAR